MAIQAQFIIEILGRPPEHIKEALQTIAIRMDTEKGVSVLEKIFHEPKLIEDSKDLYTTFTELTLEIDTTETLFHLLFTYMPAHIEIITPEKMTLSNFEFNELTNHIMQRLHNYDAIAKKMLNDRQALLQKLHEVAPHLFKEENKQQPIKKKKRKK